MAHHFGKVVLYYLFTVVLTVNRTTLDEYINSCVNEGHHKSKPGKESSLFGNCSPWKDRSCCTKQRTQDIHVPNYWYNLTLNHCGQLSENCRKHFIQDMCFYECSPNVGPWLKESPNSAEKIMDVPFCETDCTNWWNDCKNEQTCIQNWLNDFNWTTGMNTCPTGTTCRPFTEVYSNSTNFCSIIWNYSWTVVADTESCIHLWFDAANGNPNDEVALAKAKELLGLNTASTCLSMYSVLTTIVYVILVQ